MLRCDADAVSSAHLQREPECWVQWASAVRHVCDSEQAGADGPKRDMRLSAGTMERMTVFGQWSIQIRQVM